MKPTNKTYNIDTFHKLLNVINKDNFEDLVICLNKFLAFQVSLKRKMEEEKLPFDAEILKCGFLWTDDGEHDMNTLHINDPETGEVTITMITKP